MQGGAVCLPLADELGIESLVRGTALDAAQRAQVRERHIQRRAAGQTDGQPPRVIVLVVLVDPARQLPQSPLPFPARTLGLETRTGNHSFEGRFSARFRVVMYRRGIRAAAVLGDPSLRVEQPKRHIAGHPLPEQLDDGRFGDLDLGREDQGLAWICAGREEGSQALSEQALRLSVRQEFELCRSHVRFLSVKRTTENRRGRARQSPPFR